METKKYADSIMKYLDWVPWNGTHPTHKHLSDNLRAYLTIAAYAVLLYYLWNWGEDKNPAWVYKSAAVIWGAWLFWFTCLTTFQTYYLYNHFAFATANAIVHVVFRNKTKEPTRAEMAIVISIYLFFFLSGCFLLTCTTYLGMAALKGAKLL